MCAFDRHDVHSGVIARKCETVAYVMLSFLFLLSLQIIACAADALVSKNTQHVFPLKHISKFNRKISIVFCGRP